MRSTPIIPRVLSLLLLAGLALSAGCTDKQLRQMGVKEDEPREDFEVEVPGDFKGTVGEVATLVSSGEQAVSGWGVVIGLVDRGSSEVPPQIRNDLIKMLRGQIKLIRQRFNRPALSVAEFLDDKDTAVVQVEAVIPPGSPKGTRVDAVVTCPPRTQTESLIGGVLLPTDLSWSALGGAGGKADLKIYASATGSIFVNPFLDPSDSEDMPRLRKGRVLNGVALNKDMPLRLQLFKPDYAISNILQKRINYRFSPERKDVAKSLSPYYVRIDIPPSYRDDYRHFLDLVMHLPLDSGAGAYEAHANRVAEAMTSPDANHNGLALVWEAMGKQILPTVRKLYTSENPAVKYYAARTGLRLDDKGLAADILLDTARNGDDPLRIEAVRELGRHPGLYRGRELLEKLLDDRNDLLRIAAYESLLKIGRSSKIRRIKVGEEFFLDRVSSSGSYIVYATRSGKPRLVLIGNDLSVCNPLFLDDKESDITVFCQDALPQEKIDELRKDDPTLSEDLLKREHLAVYRRLPNSMARSETFHMNFQAWELVSTLGMPPRPDRKTGSIQGLGLTYSQIVGLLYRMCDENLIPAKFVLQELPEIQRIIRTAPAGPRPERPE